MEQKNHPNTNKANSRRRVITAKEVDRMRMPDDDRVDQASKDSFPASDPPAHKTVAGPGTPATKEPRKKSKAEE